VPPSDPTDDARTASSGEHASTAPAALGG